MARLTMSADRDALGWTIPDALAKFAEAGMPLDETGFRAIVRAADRLGTLQRVGEIRKPTGSKGGRGQFLYDIGGMQRLHAALAEWLTAGNDMTAPAADS